MEQLGFELLSILGTGTAGNNFMSYITALAPYMSFCLVGEEWCYLVRNAWSWGRCRWAFW